MSKRTTKAERIEELTLNIETVAQTITETKQKLDVYELRLAELRGKHDSLWKELRAELKGKTK